MPGLVAGHHPADHPPGPAGPGPGLGRPAVAAPPHPAPGPAGPALPRAGPGRRDLRLLVHPHQPGRDHAGQGRRRGALVPAPHHRREHLPRQQARRRTPAPALGIPARQHGLDVGCPARRLHGRLAAPAHRPHRGPGDPGRPRRPRRQGHDRHPAVAADRGPCPAHPPRPAADPAAAARLPPARRGPRPPPGTPRSVLTARPPRPDPETRKPRTRRDTRTSSLSAHPKPGRKDQLPLRRSTQRHYSRIRVIAHDQLSNNQLEFIARALVQRCHTRRSVRFGMQLSAVTRTGAATGTAPSLTIRSTTAWNPLSAVTNTSASVMLLRGQSVILLLAIRADRKRLVVLCGHEENATDSPNGCALDRAPSEMRAVRIVAVSAWLGLIELSPGDKGFELGDTFGPPARLSNVRVGVLVAIPALLRRTQGDE